jgi:hypothetical protein
MTDPISRRDAKGNDLLKRDDVSTAVYVAIKEVLGVTAVRAKLGYAIEDALDKLPALDADGRWENLLHNLKVRRDELHRNYPFTIEEGVLERIIVEMEGDAPPAAERRPAVERPACPMILTTTNGEPEIGKVWFVRADDTWASADGKVICTLHDSTAFAEVDRDNSDQEAIRLYDSDITSGDAAQPGE